MIERADGAFAAALSSADCEDAAVARGGGRRGDGSSSSSRKDTGSTRFSGFGTGLAADFGAMTTADGGTATDAAST